MATRHHSAALSTACSAYYSLCFSLLPSPSLHPLLICPLPPIDVRHFVVSFTKKYVCHFTVVGLPGNSGNAKLLCSPNCAQVTPGLRESGSEKWESKAARERERERAKRARYNEAWLPRQQRQRQRNGDCDCLCLSSLCCSYLCSWCCY